MNELIIHAGNLKTGSSAIQKFLHINVSEITKLVSLRVPNIEKGSGAHAALADSAIRSPDDVSPSWSALRRDLAGLSDQTVLLTSEVFIRTPAAHLHARLAPFSDVFSARSPRVLFYLRPHIEMVTSNYSQNVKTGFWRRTPLEAEAPISKDRATDFVSSVNDFSSFFGIENIECREYARKNFEEGNVVLDFLDAIDAPELKSLVRGAETGSVNVSPSAETLMILHHLRQHYEEVNTDRFRNLFTRMFTPLSKRLAIELNAVPMTKFRLPVEMQERIKDKFEPDRVRMIEAYGIKNPSAAWLDEPVVAPERPKNLPLDIVQGAFEEIALRAEREGHVGIVLLLRKVAANFPTTLEGGVPSIAMPRLRPHR